VSLEIVEPVVVLPLEALAALVASEPEKYQELNFDSILQVAACKLNLISISCISVKTF